MPNLFVVLVLFIGLFVGKKLGVVFGLLFGIILDMMFGKTVGGSGVLLAIIGLIGEYFDKNFSKDSRIMIISISAISTLIFEVGIYLLNFIQFHIDVEIVSFAIKVLVEIIFNTLLILIFYPGMKRLGYYLEESFKGRKLLTRYF